MPHLSATKDLHGFQTGPPREPPLIPAESSRHSRAHNIIIRPDTDSTGVTRQREHHDNVDQSPVRGPGPDPARLGPEVFGDQAE